MIPPKDSQHQRSMPEEQSMISGIQARYDHDHTIPKTLDINKDQMHLDPYGTGNTAGFQVFNNQAMRTTQARHLQAATFKQATDPGEGIDHYKKLFSFSKYTIFDKIRIILEHLR